MKKTAMKKDGRKREDPASLKARAREILKILKRLYPQSQTALQHEDTFQLLVSTILSAQCTDARVNMVTPGLFARYPTPVALAALPQEALEREIKSTGFYHNKAKSIRACCRMIVDTYGGRVPETMEELVKLPGVGRKTANCILGNALGIPSGVVVDTHVFRLAHRIGLSDKKDPNKVEQDLMPLFPRTSWVAIGNMLIDHGRKICNARKPLCDRCPLIRHCPTGAEFLQAAHA